MSKPSAIISLSSFHIFLLLQCLLLTTVKTEECIETSNPKTRIFKSLADLQTNNETFDPRGSDFKGNYVAFSNIEMTVLQKNSFYAYGSNHIEKLSLDNHEISLIINGAFISLKCLRYLDLRKNRITNIAKGMFQDLTKLHELNLEENLIAEIPDAAFSVFIRLKILNISKNKLKALHIDAFYRLTTLHLLDLSYNNLKDISPFTFQYCWHLNNLQLGNNQIEYLELDKSKNLQNLKILNLSNNALECFDTTYNYSFSLNLTELYLNGNRLFKMDADGFKKSLTVLKIIDLENNPWLCSDLIPVVQILNDSHISYKASSHDEPNVSGIACNKSADIFKRNKSNYDIPTQLETLTTTTDIPQFNNKKEENVTTVPYVVNPDELSSIKRTQTVIVCFLVLIAIFIMADAAVRCGFLNFWINRRRHTFLDNEDDDGASLRDRL